MINLYSSRFVVRFCYHILTGFLIDNFLLFMSLKNTYLWRTIVYRCPFQCCKNCCYTAQNPCHIHGMNHTKILFDLNSIWMELNPFLSKFISLKCNPYLNFLWIFSDLLVLVVKQNSTLPEKTPTAASPSLEHTPKDNASIKYFSFHNDNFLGYNCFHIWKEIILSESFNSTSWRLNSLRQLSSRYLDSLRARKHPGKKVFFLSS